MQIDPTLGPTALILMLIFMIGLLLQALKQPHVVAYIAAGVLLGSTGLGIIDDVVAVERLGGLGVTLLLFFVGMEIDAKGLIRGWRFSILGTLAQIVISVALAFAVGTFFDWSFGRSLLLGFVISLSSTAVVLKLMEDWNQIDTRLGRDTVGVLIVQDIAAIGMIITIGAVASGSSADTSIPLIPQLIGGLSLTGLLIWVGLGRSISLPFMQPVARSQDLQVFGALAICFGLAWVSAALGLSTALGAFAGGLIVGAARQTVWVKRALEPFRAVFLGLFFVSVGLMIDLDFVLSRALPIALLVLAVLISSMVVNTLIYRFSGYDWRQSIYGGALLAQPGEFSFVLAALGASVGLVMDTGYQLAISVIAISLALSPIHIQLVRAWVKPETSDPKNPLLP